MDYAAADSTFQEWHWPAANFITIRGFCRAVGWFDISGADARSFRNDLGHGWQGRCAATLAPVHTMACASWLVPGCHLWLSLRHLVGNRHCAPAGRAQWPRKGLALIFTSYLPLLLTYNFIIPLGEEPGWRGFALPRLQAKYGPLLGSVILGTLHGLWHLPAFFVNGTSSLGSFSFIGFALFIVSAIGLTLAFTWVFNNVGGSPLLMILLHGSNEAYMPFVQRLIPVFPKGADLWIEIVLVAVYALLVIGTKGRLSYKRNRVEQPSEPSPVSSMPSHV